MRNIYMANYVCKSITDVGLLGCLDIGVPGFNDVVLGLEGGNESSDITVKGTVSAFVKGKKYLIVISEI